MDVVEATLGGAVNSVANLLCSKLSVNEGTLLRDLVVTFGGAGEVIASFLDGREPVVELSIELRFCKRCSRDFDGEQRVFSGLRGRTEGGGGGEVRSMLSSLVVFGVRKGRNFDESLAMLLTSFLSSLGSVLRLLMRLRNEPIVARVMADFGE